ncbi:MAG: hypothetical protein AAFR38_07505 [Planctomycetota bacterium]
MREPLHHAAAIALACTVAANTADAQPAIIDERFDDWSAGDLLATDPAGDSRVDGFDLTRVWARTHGTTLYVSFEFDGTLRSLQSGELLAQPQLAVTLPNGNELVVFHRQRFAVVIDSPLASSDDLLELPHIPWPLLDYTLLPTVASPRYELRVDLAPAGAAIGDTIGVHLESPTVRALADSGDGIARVLLSAPDNIDTPIELELTPPGSPAPRVPTDRAPGTDIRVAVFNVLASQLTEADTPDIDDPYDRLSRLVRAARADIYLFQEQSGSRLDLSARLTTLDPLDNGALWFAHTDDTDSRFGSDFVLATRPLIPVTDAIANPFAAAVVGDDPETAVLVLSIHPKCCGYAGSSEDDTRIAEADQTAEMIARFRRAELGPELAPFADVPVIVAGDWNLVGSNTPREILTAPDGPALDHMILLKTDGRDAATWRALNGLGFTPGLLDLVAFSPESLEPLGGFVVDTERMTPSELQALGLRPLDSLVSDHLMLVADFKLRGPALDVNDDGRTDIDDLHAWTLAPTDLNDDAVADNRDAALLIAYLRRHEAFSMESRGGRP